MRKLITAALASLLAASLLATGSPGRPCQREFGHDPGQRPRWALICE